MWWLDSFCQVCLTPQCRIQFSECWIKSLEKELKEFCKEFNTMGKCKASPDPHKSPVTCKFWEWESASDSDIAEDNSLSGSSWKWWRCDIPALELLSRGTIPFPDSEPVEVGPGHVLSLIGFTKVGEQGPDPPLPTAHIDVAVLTTFTSSLWGRGVLLFTVQTHIQWCQRSRTGIGSFGDQPLQASAYMRRNLSILNVVIFGLVVILS